MAEIEFVVAEERPLEILSALFATASIAIDEKSSVIDDVSELHGRLTKGLQQFFVKSGFFSKEDFVIKWIESNSGLSRYTVDQFAGDGHLTLRTLPLRISDETIFRLSVCYQSFFVNYNGTHVCPSDELKLFYKNLVKDVSKETKNSEIWPGRFMRVQKDLLEENPAVLESVLASFRRS